MQVAATLLSCREPQGQAQWKYFVKYLKLYKLHIERPLEYPFLPPSYTKALVALSNDLGNRRCAQQKVEHENNKLEKVTIPTGIYKRKRDVYQPNPTNTRCIM